MTLLNGSKLKEIGHSSHSAEVVNTSLACRERNRGFSDIMRMNRTLIKNGEKIVLSDFMKYWKDLESLGVGSIVYGRKGKPTRFEWYYSLKKVAQAAMEGSNIEVEKLKETSFTPVKRRGRPKKTVAPQQKEKYVEIFLKKGVTLKIDVNALRELQSL